jgi:hypothetical protein
MTPADRVAAAHERLLEGMIERTPSCEGVDLFTADVIERADQAILRSICAGCDLAILCRQYAELDQPKAGFWAGKRYGTNGRPAEAAEAA